MKEFTEKELALYNGENGKPAYVAYKGKVYSGKKLLRDFPWLEFYVIQTCHRRHPDLYYGTIEEKKGGDLQGNSL
jgi:hypothetical protein